MLRIIQISLIVGVSFLAYSIFVYVQVIYPSYMSSPVPAYAEDPYAFLFFTSEDIVQSVESSLLFWFDQIEPRKGTTYVHVFADFYRPMSEVGDENSTYFVLQVFQKISDADVIVNGQSPKDYGGRVQMLNYPQRATSYLLIDIPNENFTKEGHMTLSMYFTWKGNFWRQSFYKYNLIVSFNTGFPSFINEVGLPKEAINGNGMLIPDVTTRASFSVAEPEAATISEAMPNPDVVGFSEGKVWYSWDLKKRSDRTRYASTAASITIQLDDLKKVYEASWSAFPLALGIGLPVIISSSIGFLRIKYSKRREILG